MTAQQQAYNLGKAWEAMSEPKRQVIFQVVKPDLEVETFRLGPHTPDMKAEDVALVHRMWLWATRDKGIDPHKLHHCDIVTVALARLAHDMSSNPDEIVKSLGNSSDPAAGQQPRQ